MFINFLLCCLCLFNSLSCKILSETACQVIQFRLLYLCLSVTRILDLLLFDFCKTQFFIYLALLLNEYNAFESQSQLYTLFNLKSKLSLYLRKKLFLFCLSSKIIQNIVCILLFIINIMCYSLRFRAQLTK